MSDYAFQQIAANLDEHAAGAPRSRDRVSPAFMDYLKLVSIGISPPFHIHRVRVPSPKHLQSIP